MSFVLKLLRASEIHEGNKNNTGGKSPQVHVNNINLYLHYDEYNMLIN